MYFYRARYYDQVVNRFGSEDLIGVEAGVNFYNYAIGDPLSYVDPFGLSALPGAQNPGPAKKIGDGLFGCLSAVFKMTRSCDGEKWVCYRKDVEKRLIIELEEGCPNCKNAYYAAEFAHRLLNHPDARKLGGDCAEAAFNVGRKCARFRWAVLVLL